MYRGRFHDRKIGEAQLEQIIDAASWASSGHNSQPWDNKIAMLECYVAFRKNWERDHNRDAIDLDTHVTNKEMKKIRERLANEFTKEFKKVLSTEGGHELVSIVVAPGHSP